MQRFLRYLLLQHVAVSMTYDGMEIRITMTKGIYKSENKFRFVDDRNDKDDTLQHYLEECYERLLKEIESTRRFQRPDENFSAHPGVHIVEKFDMTEVSITPEGMRVGGKFPEFPLVPLNNIS